MISIGESLLGDLKRWAAERGTTVGHPIEDSLRLVLAAQPGHSPESDDVELVTYDGGRRFTGLNVDRTSVLLELEELERHGARKPRPGELPDIDVLTS